ncbi:hypothetical protein PCURB6_13790 [Paenibacillus curdlanolyticus]|nr:hypothetical protein PCURB6_13790 [Paenibacillus curdlanolyticus]
MWSKDSLKAGYMYGRRIAVALQSMNLTGLIIMLTNEIGKKLRQHISLDCFDSILLAKVTVLASVIELTYL